MGQERTGQDRRGQDRTGYEGLKEEEQKQQQQHGEDDNEEEGQVPTILTAENYRQQVEEELEQRGITVTDEIRERHINPIADLC